jgi:hypothetical protein
LNSMDGKMDMLRDGTGDDDEDQDDAVIVFFM